MLNMYFYIISFCSVLWPQNALFSVLSPQFLAPMYCIRNLFYLGLVFKIVRY